MTRILMVCLGNICRSPLAEGILRSKLPQDRFVIDSAGTGNYHIGNPPDSRSIKVADKYGLDITSLRGRQFTRYDFDNFDLIYVMDASNYESVMSLARTEDDKAKVKFVLNEIYPDQNHDVPDPYTGTIHGFENVFKMLDEACEQIAQNLQN